LKQTFPSSAFAGSNLHRPARLPNQSPHIRERRKDFTHANEKKLTENEVATAEEKEETRQMMRHRRSNFEEVGRRKRDRRRQKKVNNMRGGVMIRKRKR